MWDAAVLGRVRAAFAGTGRPYATETGTRVAALLDAYGGSWSTMRGEVCKALQVEKQRGEIVRLRDACLDRRRDQLRALTTLFGEKPDAEILDRAVTAAAGLPPVASCADAEALAARVPPPEDPALRARVAKLQPDIDRMTARLSAGKYADALRIGEPLLAEAETIDFAPLRAQVQVGMGNVRDRTGDYTGAEALLRAGGVSAAEGRDDVLAAEAASALLLVVGDHQLRFDEATGLMAAGRMVVARARDPRAEAHWLGNEGLVLTEMHRYAEADVAFDRALAIDEKLLGPDHPDLARLLANRGRLYEVKGDHPRAKLEYERALAILTKALDPDHPDVLTMEHDIARELDELGNLPEALALHEHILAAREKALGPDHPSVAASLNNLGLVLKEMGEWAKAKTALERALAIKEKTLAPDHPGIAITVDILGELSYSLGDYPAALVLFKRALAIWEKVKGPAHPDVAYALFGIGRTLVGLGQSEAALPLLEHALKLREKAQGPTNPAVSQPLIGLGQLYLARHRPEQAAPLFERALTLDSHDPDPEILLGLAEALWETGAERPRARALVEQALAYYQRVGHQAGIAVATRWLTEHP